MTTTVYDLGDLVEARLADQPGYSVLRGGVSVTPPGAYVVLYFGAGQVGSLRFDGRSRRHRWDFRAVCAGASDAQVLNTVDRVRQRLTDWRPLPEDRSAGRLLELDTAPPLLRDDSVTSVRYSLTLTYRLHLTRS